MGDPARRRPRTPPATLMLALALALAPAGRLAAQTRPLQTEEAGTRPGGSLALELGGAFQSAQPGYRSGGARDFWSAPVINLVYSPADNVELDFEWVGRVGAVDDPAFGSVSDFGDATLRAKLRLVEERPGRAAFGLRFATTLPETGDELGLGPDALRFSVQLLLSKTLGRLRLHLNGGIAIHDEALAAGSQNDLLAYGAALELRLSGRAALLAEAAGRAGPGEPAIDRTHEARLGLRLGGPRLGWDVAVRRGLSDSDGEWGVTGGLRWLARGGSP